MGVRHPRAAGSTPRALSSQPDQRSSPKWRAGDAIYFADGTLRLMGHRDDDYAADASNAVLVCRVDDRPPKGSAPPASSVLPKVLVHEGDREAALANGGGDTLDRA
jgi:hypothetical protein